MRVVRLIRWMLSGIIIYWLIMSGLFISHAYAKGWIFANFDSIAAKDAISHIDNNASIILLDVRTTEEFKQEHLENAINIHVKRLEKYISKLDKMKDKQIYVYCRSGNRSVKASRILKKRNFTPINIKGGIQQLSRHHAKMEK